MKYLLSFITAVFVAAPAAQASGLQASPSRLELAAEKGQKTEFVVANPTQEVLLLQITPDAFGSLLEISPKSLVLEAGARKNITVSVKNQAQDDFSGSSLSTHLSIIASPLAESEVAINTGIKLPLTVSLQTKSKSNTAAIYLYSAGGAVLAGFGGLAWLLMRPKRKPKENFRSSL